MTMHGWDRLNPNIRKFNQCRIEGGAIGRNCELLGRSADPGASSWVLRAAFFLPDDVMNLTIARVKEFALSLVMENAYDLTFVRMDCDTATECNIAFDSPDVTANRLGVLSVARYNELKAQGVFGGNVSHNILFYSFY